MIADDATTIDEVALLVPAWNEDATIGRCVAHLAATAEAVHPVRVSLTLVADRCTDHTVERALRSWPGEVAVIDVIAGSAGRARHIGAAAVLDNCGPDLSTTWVATTDADSFVPRDWLSGQLAYAASGVDGVAGTIDLVSWESLPPASRVRYRQMLEGARRADGQHTDVFAANLGVRASALAAVGGFPDIPCGEDHAVWRALVAAGHATVAPADLVVRTSGRLRGRAIGGLADFLTGLARGGLGGAERTPA